MWRLGAVVVVVGPLLVDSDGRVAVDPSLCAVVVWSSASCVPSADNHDVGVGP